MTLDVVRAGVRAVVDGGDLVAGIGLAHSNANSVAQAVVEDERLADLRLELIVIPRLDAVAMIVLAVKNTVLIAGMRIDASALFGLHERTLRLELDGLTRFERVPFPLVLIAPASSSVGRCLPAALVCSVRARAASASSRSAASFIFETRNSRAATSIRAGVRPAVRKQLSAHALSDTASPGKRDLREHGAARKPPIRTTRTSMKQRGKLTRSDARRPSKKGRTCPFWRGK